MNIIKKNGKTIAYVFDGEFAEGTKGITDPTSPLQILSLKHPKGKVWQPHVHLPRERKTSTLLEAIIVLQGKLHVSILYKEEYIEKITLGPGMGILILDGAMRMEAVEDIVMLEFKNGPFLEDKMILDDSKAYARKI